MKCAKILILMLVAAPMLMMVSCNKEKASSSTMRFKLTDAPGAYEAVNIDIQGVRVHSSTQGWVTFSSDLGVVNILDYANGQTTLIAEGTIDASTITQAQLILGSNNSVVIGGQTIQLSSPAQLQSGLTLNLNNTLAAGGTYEWTIDFDAAQSINISAGGSYVLTPTLHLMVDAASSASANASTDGSITIGASGSGSGSGGVTVGGSGSGSGGVTIGGSASGSSSGSTVIVGDLAGSVSGSISSTVGLSMVYATNASGQVVSSTMTSLSGSFSLQAMTAGSYTITIDPVLPLLSSHVMSNVQVNAGATTNLGVVTM
jgi:hypothetical protein